MHKKLGNINLNITDDENALKVFISSVKSCDISLKQELLPVIHSLGRTAAEPILAKLSSPAYNAAAMDGIAVCSQSTINARDDNPVKLSVNNDFIYVNTGECIYPPYNSVIMIENIHQIDNFTVEIKAPSLPNSHVRLIGEDITQGEMIVNRGHKIRPVDIGALLTGGITEIQVYSMATVGIIPTGSEIVEPGTPMKDGLIIESNSRVLEGLVLSHGGIPKRYPIVADDYHLLKDCISTSIQDNDITIICAGSSAGTKDFTAKLIDELGELILHGIAIKPGRPSILGIANKKPIIGLPGYPVASYLVFETYIAPIIKMLTDQIPTKPHRTKAFMCKNIRSNPNLKEFFLVKLENNGEKPIAIPLNKGSGSTMSLVKADGVVVLPCGIDGIRAGDIVEVELFNS